MSKSYHSHKKSRRTRVRLSVVLAQCQPLRFLINTTKTALSNLVRRVKTAKGTFIGVRQIRPILMICVSVRDDISLVHIICMA